MNAVERVIAILDYLASSRTPCGVTEISNRFKISKSSVSRVLSSLERMHFVEQHSDDKYTPSIKILVMLMSILSSLDIRNISLPYLYELQNSTNETVVLNLCIGLKQVSIEQIGNNQPGRQAWILGMKDRDPWIGASGRAMLAFMGEKEIDEAINSLKRMGGTTLVSGHTMVAEKLRVELLKVKKQGYAVSQGEIESILTSVASPIFDSRNNVIAVVFVLGPSRRFNLKTANSYGPLLRETTKKISSRLGASDYKGT